MAEREGKTEPGKPVVHDRSGTPFEMLALAYPLMISFLSFSLMGVVDTYIMGRVGTPPQGGVGLGMSLSWTVVCLFAGTMTAVTTFVAQSRGAEKTDTLYRWVIAAFSVAVPASLLVWLVIPLVPHIVTLLKTTEEVKPYVIPYLSIRLFGTPFLLMNFVLSAFLRGLGDTKTPMVVTLIANLVNAGMDIVLVFGILFIPPLGIRGAAWATVFSQGIGAALYFRVYLSKKKHLHFGTRQWVWIKLDEVLRFLKVGLPVGATWFVESLSWTLMSIYIATIDPSGLSAHAIVFQLLHVSFMPAVAISVAASTLVGQYLGAERIDLAKRAARNSILGGVLFMGLVGLLFALFRSELIFFFNPDQAVVKMGGIVLLIAAGFQVFDALGITISGVLRGAGDTRYPLFAQVGAAWAVFIPLIFIFGKVFGWGVYGAWLASLVFVILFSILMLRRFFGGRWLKVRVV